MRFFNTEGPVNCADHYCLPPLTRFDMEEVTALIAQKKYFLLHAPRQTGKTSCLLALADYLNRAGQYRAIYANIENAQAARENVTMGMTAVVEKVARAARDQLGDARAVPLALQVLGQSSPTTALEEYLTLWCEEGEKPTVLLLDEVDALVGDTLISLLRQLRAGYPRRPAQFRQTVILCGVRDLQDYRIQSSSELTVITQLNLESQQNPAWYIRPDGRLDMPRLLAAFQQFFRENSEVWLERFDYKEARPQLLMQAFLQRIINGGGRVDREYGLGRRRTDLLVVWNYPGGVQRAVIELKLLRDSLEKTLTTGLAQTWEYADRSGAEEAHLVIFDRTPGVSWDAKSWQRAERYQDQPITVWGM